MKNHSNPFQEDPVDDEQYHNDVVNMLIQLSKNVKQTQIPNNILPFNFKPLKRVQEPPISEESDFCSTSLRQAPSPKSNKTHKIHKQNSQSRPHLPKKESKLEIQNAQAMQIDETFQQQLPLKSLFSIKSQTTLLRNGLEMIEQKQRNVQDLLQNYEKLEQNYKQNQKQYQLQRNQQEKVLRSILEDSFSKKIAYQSYIEHFNIQRQRLIENQTNFVVKPLAKYLRDQETKSKPKKGKKNQSMSDEEQHKMSQSMVRQKNPYFAVVASKLQKERQKYGSMQLEQNSFFIKPLSQHRKSSISQISVLQKLSLLCAIQGINQNIQQIYCLEHQKCQYLLLTCLKFNPMTSHEKRKQIYKSMQNIFQIHKKIVSVSTHCMFSHKASPYISVTSLSQNDDQIMILNEYSHETPLNKYLIRMQLNPSELLTTVKYIVRMSLKVIQQISQQTANKHIVILPSNLYFDDKFQFKIKNMIFNEILYRQFKHLTLQNQIFFYPPQQAPDSQSLSLWSVGIMVYALLFNQKPFQNYMPYSWSSRQEFLVVNQLEVPNNNILYQKCKDFIWNCLSKKGNISFSQLCNDPFFGSSK